MSNYMLSVQNCSVKIHAIAKLVTYPKSLPFGEDKHMGQSVNTTYSCPSAPYRDTVLILISFSWLLFFLSDNANSMALAFIRLPNSGFPPLAHFLLSVMASSLPSLSKIGSQILIYIFMFLTKISNLGGVTCYLNVITNDNDKTWAKYFKYI